MSEEFKWNERVIATAISRQTLSRRCVLLVNNCVWTGHECDVLGVTNDLRVIDIEIKCSRADLRADAKKDKWWHRQFVGYGPKEETLKDGQLIRITHAAIYNETALQWPPRVWKHYYALPEHIWKPDLLDRLPSPASGILLATERSGVVSVRCERKCRPNKDASRLTPEQVMSVARLSNMRMWDAYERLDVANREVKYWSQQVKAAA